MIDIVNTRRHVCWVKNPDKAKLRFPEYRFLGLNWHLVSIYIGSRVQRIQRGRIESSLD